MDDFEAHTPATPGTETPETGGDTAQTEGRRQLVEKLADRIRTDRSYHGKAFERMREDMASARRGAPKNWPENSYKANITGRHINQKVAALYAKDPKAIARRPDRMDFVLWDENPQTLQQAMGIIQMAQQTVGQDPAMAQAMGVVPPQAVAAYEQAMALLQDVQKGMTHRDNAKKTGKTLEILFNYFMNEQSPVTFKTSMKRVVRRASTTGVGYVKLGFQRELGLDPGVSEKLADFRKQLARAKRLAEELEDSSDTDQDLKQAELEASIASLEQQEYVLLREGLVFDFPKSTRVIPDKMTETLVGFVGARWVTVEYLYTPDEVKEIFGVELGKDFREYSLDGTNRDTEQGELELGDKANDGLACVWEHYDREAGVVYYVCDGHAALLREPGPPDVYVEDFWPVFALTFNEVEDEDELFPPSDVRLIQDMQAEYNRARQGQREHRQAARPRYITPSGVLGDEDKQALSGAKPFSVTELNIDIETDMRQVLQAVPTSGVDPNLYETGQIMTDIQLVAGAQEAQFGAVAKATATESSIAESSRIASVDSNVDDLDGFLTRVARASGQIMFREMSQQQVVEIAGPGAVWPQLTLEEIAKEVFLEVEAGSSGRPNQAQEIRNWKEMLPFLVQMPGLEPTFLARETLTRLDDKMDLTQAIVEGLPSIMAMNGMQQVAPQDPANAPDAQGAEGAGNAPAAPGGGTGTGAGMGNNQV